VNENAPAGSSILEVSATDEDAGENGKVYYRYKSCTVLTIPAPTLTKKTEPQGLPTREMLNPDLCVQLDQTKYPGANVMITHFVDQAIFLIINFWHKIGVFCEKHFIFSAKIC
jgi:hypothetical protein